MPLQIGLIRHGHSVAQEAREMAERAGHLQFAFEPSDALAPLSPLGEQQSRRLGEWLRQRKFVASHVFSSPFRRTKDTAELVVEAAGFATPILLDHGLEEIAWGEFDGLTKAGRRAYHPELFEQHRRDKFHNSPPGGESWKSVAERVRPVAQRITSLEGVVFVVAHEVTLKCFRYVLENLSPEQTLALPDIPNASLTLYRCDAGGLCLQLENFVPGAAV